MNTTNKINTEMEARELTSKCALKIDEEDKGKKQSKGEITISYHMFKVFNFYPQHTNKL